MKPVIECRYRTTRTMLREFGRKHAVGPRPGTTLLFGGFCIWQAISWFTAGMPAAEGTTLLMVLACFALVQLLPEYYAHSTMRSTKRCNGGAFPETCVTFGNTIEMQEGSGCLTVEYRMIRRVLRLKHSYVLMTSLRTGLMLREDGFNEGGFEAFKALLHKKRPDLKIPE